MIIIMLQVILLGTVGLAYYFLNEVCLSVGDCSSFTRREFGDHCFFQEYLGW